MSALLLRCAAVPAEFAPHAAIASTPGFVLVDVTIRDGRIERVTPTPVPSRAQHDAGGLNPASGEYEHKFDCCGRVVLPGFIDVHIHGADGFDTMDASSAALTRIAKFVAQHGVTGFYATTMTAAHTETLAATQAAGDFVRNYDDTAGARLLGVHLEGPYISPKFPGAQKASDIRLPASEEFRELIASGPVRLITLAPEQPGADVIIGEACRRGIVPVIGHSNASYEECLAAVDRGATQATHTFNAMSGLHHRRPGVVGAVLSSPLIYAQLIADNIHVHPAAMNILARCKGSGRTILITDAMRATGLPDGEYDLGGQPVTVADGQCRLVDGTLAGSVLTMEKALVNLLGASGWSLGDAWPATSRTAAESLGIAHEYGAIRPGYRADLTILNDDLAVDATIVAGQFVYSTDSLDTEVM